MKLAMTLLAAALAAGPCLAQSANGPLAFTVSVNGTSGCSFPGVSYVTQFTQTISNEWAAHSTFTDIVVTKHSDGCTSLLYQLVAYGTQLSSAIISVQGTVNGSVREVKRLSLAGATITAISVSGSIETVRFSFTSMKTRWYDGTEESMSKN